MKMHERDRRSGSNDSMNPSRSRINKPTFRLGRLINICVLAAGIGLTGAASRAETVFSLYKSTDHGASWFEAGEGLPPGARINALIMAGKVAVAGTDRGVFISGDGATKWQPPQKGIATESRVLCFAAHGGRVFAGTHKHGVLVSGDEGTTWKAVNVGLTDLYVRSLLTVGTRLYAGTDSRGVFVSEHAGASWANQRNGLPESSQVFDLASSGGNIFAGLYSKGLYRWESERGLWVKSGDVSPLELVTAGETLVAGHNPGGVFVSEDQGKTWQDGNHGLPANAPVWTLDADDERVLVGTSGKVGFVSDEIGLFASKDRGKSWTKSDAGLPPSSAPVSFVLTKQFYLVGISARKTKD